MKTGFCMGILWDDGYRERTCKQRDNCRYYVEGFYARNIEHIDDYEQLHNTPGKPCHYFLPREEKKEKTNEIPF